MFRIIQIGQLVIHFLDSSCSATFGFAWLLMAMFYPTALMPWLDGGAFLENASAL